MPILQVRFLGTIEISFAGEKLPLPATRKAQSLLAYLILNRGKSQPRNRLVELFWGDRPEEKARGSLSTALWHISHCLPEKKYILSDATSVQFNPDLNLCLDSEQFISLISPNDIIELQSALALYKGDFMDGFYDDWIIQERYRLESLYLDGLARLMSAFEMKMEYNAALETALHLLTLDSLREDAHRVAMRVYCQVGQRNAALEQYQRCRESVMNELGIEPMTDTIQLYESILTGQVALGVAPSIQQLHPVILESSRQPVHDPLNLGIQSPYFGRETEVASLETAWQNALNSIGKLILIDGEAGVGKTRLVDEFANRLRWKGIQVLSGRCYEFERILPYQPVVEVLRSALPILTQVKSSDNWVIREISRLVPEIAGYESNIQATILPDQEQARLFEGIAQFLREISQPNGLVIVLEDLHWAVESTLELLHYLVRHLAGQSILFLGTLRTEEVGTHHLLRSLRENLNRDELVQELHLKRLAEGDVETLVFSLSGRSDEAILPLICRLYRETDGNPFFLMEVLKALFERRLLFIEKNAWQGDFDQVSRGEFPLPASLNEAISNRFNRLDENAREVLHLAAVIGREFDYHLLKEVWGRDAEQTLQVLDTLLRRQLILEGSGPASRDYVFCHHKIQEVLYADIPRQRRWQIHAQIGTLIEKTFATQLDDYAGELAYHFLQACHQNEKFTGKAIDYLLKAGDKARILYAYQEAVAHYKQALELTKKIGDYEYAARIDMKLGGTYHNAFDYEQAHKAFDEGFQLWQRSALVNVHPTQTSYETLKTNWFPITSIDPAYAIDLPSAVVWQLFSGLVMFGSSMEVVPDVAQKWEILSGGREYIFHLKNDLRWSDGNQLLADDFEFSGKRILAPETKSPMANLLYDIKGAMAFHNGQLIDPHNIGLKAIDPMTLLVELEKPAPYFLQLLASFMPIPRHVVESFGNDWVEPEHIVTNGPFNLEMWKKGECMLLVRNPDYHGIFTGNIRKVELCLCPEPATQLAMYADNQLDVLDMRFYPIADYEKATREFVGEYFSFPWALINYLGFDVRRPPFQDGRVRKAFALAIDKDMLAGGIQKNSVFPAAGGFIPPGLPGHSPGIALPFDPEQAKELLAQAGYPDGRKFPTIQALTHLSQNDPVNNYLSGQWQEILNLKITWETVNPGLHLILELHPPNIFLSHWLGDYPDPDDFLGASQIRNWTGWQDVVFDQLLEETRNTHDQVQRLNLFKQADKLLVELASVIPLTYDRQHLLMKPWLKRYPTSPIFSWFWKDVVIDTH